MNIYTLIEYMWKLHVHSVTPDVACINFYPNIYQSCQCRNHGGPVLEVMLSILSLRLSVFQRQLEGRCGCQHNGWQIPITWKRFFPSEWIRFGRLSASPQKVQQQRGLHEFLGFSLRCLRAWIERSNETCPVCRCKEGRAVGLWVGIDHRLPKRCPRVSRSGQWNPCSGSMGFKGGTRASAPIVIPDLRIQGQRTFKTRWDIIIIEQVDVSSTDLDISQLMQQVDTLWTRTK